MDRLESIRIFLAVAELGSFAKAARRLNRSPSGITRAVADLEARLGVTLLARTTRSVKLTDPGRRFFAGARRMLSDLDDLEHQAAGQGSIPRGELVITAPIVFGRLHVLPIVATLLDRFPDITARLVLVDRSVDLIEEGIDAAVRIGALQNSSAIATQLGTVRRVVVAAPSYLSRRGTPQSPSELADHDIVAFANLFGGPRWTFRKGDDALDVRISPRLTVTTAEAAIDAARSGLGLTRVLSYQLSAAFSEGSLVEVLSDFEDEKIPVHIVFADGRHVSAKLRAFVDLAAPRLRRVLKSDVSSSAAAPW